MDFLKEILGDDLYSQLEAKINEHNGKEENKEKQVKIGNLGSGEFVGKGKHDSEIEKLNNLLSGKTTELETANKFIADLKKNNKDNDDLQGKVTDYETTIANLQNKLKETQLNSALKVALLSEKVVDVDYLTFKLNEKMKEQGKALELDENENIKGWDDIISGLKTQFPGQFESASGNLKGTEIEQNKLPKSEKRDGFTREEILKKPYAERQQIYNADPEAYKEIMKQ